MSLENEEGMQWFRKGWARGRQQSTPADIANKIYERTISDARLIAQFKASCPEPIWNSPCTPPDGPGVYMVMLAGVHPNAWDEESPDDQRYETASLYGYAHWNGLRWSHVEFQRWDGSAPVITIRRFNPRQDYPWREVAA